MGVIFFLISFILIASALAVVSFKNPIYSALSLILNLLMVAGLFATLEAHFLAAVQVIVYAGAIMVLVLFMLMLLNLKIEVRSKRETSLTIVALVVGIAFLMTLAPYLNETFSAFSTRTGTLPGTVKAMGMQLYGRYVFLFQASGILLMTAVVGALMLAKLTHRGRP